MDNNDDVDSPPYAFVLTPLIVFIVVGILATAIQMRRRRRLRRMGLWPPPQHAGTTRRIGPDGTWIPVIVRGGFPPQGGAGRSGHLPGGRRGAGNGPMGVRSEEGLNELGEAPPPYDPKAKKDIEMGDLERGGANPPGYGAVGGTLNGNPYSSLYGNSYLGGEGSEIRPPAPVVTR